MRLFLIAALGSFLALQGCADWKPTTSLAAPNLSALSSSPLITAQHVPDEPTEIFIRRLAGLSAASAVGQIQITDVGHHPSDRMVSIVAKHNVNGWVVSYACAASPYCATGANHDAQSYILSSSDSDQVDAILKELSAGVEPGGTLPSPTVIAGYARVSINYMGFKRDYRRGSFWGEELGNLKSLLSPPAR